jgi:hypothetical protein
VARSVDYMSLMLFYMADSFHSARTPKLRLAHLKRLPFPVSLTLRGTCHLNPLPPRPRGSCAFQAFYPRRSASASLSARKICPAYFFDRNRTSKKLRQLPKPRLSAAAHYNQLTKSTNMSTALNNNSTRSRVPGTVAISDDEMRRFAPSVFASQPIEGVSERYSFLPTSSILNGMRENGWVPVRAQEQSIRTEARRGFQKHFVRFARGEHLQTWERTKSGPRSFL